MTVPGPCTVEFVLRRDTVTATAEPAAGGGTHVVWRRANGEIMTRAEVVAYLDGAIRDSSGPPSALGLHPSVAEMDCLESITRRRKGPVSWLLRRLGLRRPVPAGDAS